MKIMIAYASKSGATKECANLLHQNNDMIEVFDLFKENPSLNDFETIIIGSGVRIGKFYRPALTFIRKNEELLLTKRVAFYLCNAYPNAFQKAVKKNIPQKLIQTAVCIKSFGGKPPFTDASSSDWLIINNVTEFIQTVSKK